MSKKCASKTASLFERMLGWPDVLVEQMPTAGVAGFAYTCYLVSCVPDVVSVCVYLRIRRHVQASAKRRQDQRRRDAQLQRRQGQATEDQGPEIRLTPPPAAITTTSYEKCQGTIKAVSTCPTVALIWPDAQPGTPGRPRSSAPSSWPSAPTPSPAASTWSSPTSSSSPSTCQRP